MFVEVQINARSSDFTLVDLRRFEFLSVQVNEVGSMLGGWIKQQARI
ncbi:MAG: hypothetical protein ACP5I1_18595 [Candidatus Hinthialibacter sp.]